MRRTRSGALMAAILLAGCAVSQQQEVELGQQGAQQVEAQLPMLNDPTIGAYVSELGARLAQNTSRTDLQWRFAVVNSDVANAFALPGGFIYINRGILARAENASELAGVLAHEIEHVVRRHSVKQMEQMQGANVGVALACALTSVCENQAAQAAIQVGGAAVFAKFSRGDEIEADEGGFATLVRSGINPTGMLTFFQKLLAEEQSSGSGGASAWFSSHPGTQDRIQDIQRLLSQVPAPELSRLPLNDSRYNAIRQRLADLPPAPAAPQ